MQTLFFRIFLFTFILHLKIVKNEISTPYNTAEIYVYGSRVNGTKMIFIFIQRQRILFTMCKVTFNLLLFTIFILLFFAMDLHT